MPRHLVDAILAVEDQRFETHRGIDPRRIAGAFLANLRAGRVAQGGSTLTQQLVKNFFLTPERTLKRKAQEALMALLVEARYDKDEILQAYLNEIYLGQRGATAIHGMGEAARVFYGKGWQRAHRGGVGAAGGDHPEPERTLALPGPGARRRATQPGARPHAPPGVASTTPSGEEARESSRSSSRR